MVCYPTISPNCRLVCRYSLLLLGTSFATVAYRLLISLPRGVSLSTSELSHNTQCSRNKEQHSKGSGTIDNQEVQMLLDSGASCSAVSKKHIDVSETSLGQTIQLVDADGRYFIPLGTSKMAITLSKLLADHTFIHCRTIICARHLRV